MPYTKKGPYGPIIYLSDKSCIGLITRFIIMMGFNLSKQTSTTHTVYNTLKFATNNKAPIKGPYYYIHNRKSVNLCYWADFRFAYSQNHPHFEEVGSGGQI
ncbi:hypothetical protein GCM10009123_16880 [Kangiella japonica]|uniref:Uncharacterized protein n=1 Tax=Kangiella japonica TaxID=647384 RepID=A0ABN0T2I5_9GAMM